MKDEAETEFEQVVRYFRKTVRNSVTEYGHQLDLARAMNDQEEVDKAHIRQEMMKTTWQIFSHAYVRATGSRAPLELEQ